MGREKLKSNGQINKIKTNLSEDWDTVKQAHKNYQSSRKSGGTRMDSAVDFADDVFEKWSTNKDGTKNYWKGSAKVGGLALGGLTLLDWLFD